MTNPAAPYHAHVYFDDSTASKAAALHEQFKRMLADGTLPNLVLVGRMFDKPVGPHPKPQFEIHFLASALPDVEALLHGSGLTCLLHPLTDHDLADHTTLATWLGDPLPLDETVLDPPGHNQGVPRFGQSHF